MHCCLGERRPDGTFSGCPMECKIAIPQFAEDPTLRSEENIRLCERCRHPIAFHLEEKVSALATQQGK